MTAVTNCTRQFKIVLLGDVNVGKSSISLQFCDKYFYKKLDSTIGASFLTQNVCIDNSKTRLELWDTAGQERYRSLVPMYYRGAHSAIIVYDITSRESFQSAQKWVDELRLNGLPDIVIALVGNKRDLIDQRVIQMIDAKNYAEEQEILFFETSAKTAYNVDKLFVTLTIKLLENDFFDPKTDTIIQVKDLSNNSSNGNKLKKCANC